MLTLAPKLQKLRLYQLDRAAIQRVASALTKARGGGVPLLTELTGFSGMSSFLTSYDIQPDTVLGVTKYFPELQSLSLSGMASPSPFYSPVRYSGFSLSAETASMPRLQQVNIKGIRCETAILEDDEMGQQAAVAFASFLDTLFACAPNLLECLFEFAMRWNEGTGTPKLGVAPLTARAEHLESLKLDGFCCTADTFQLLHAPKLKNLKFRTRPGADTASIEAAVQAMFPEAKLFVAAA